MREYDEADGRDDDRDDHPRPAAFPTGVRIAGIIWIVFGALGLITQVLTLAVNAGQGNPAAPVCGFLFAVVFLMIGVQTVQGKAKTSLANGVGSIVFSLIYFGLGVGLLAMGAAVLGRQPNVNPGAESALMIGAAVLVLFGVILFVAGVLAIVGNTAYKEWRTAEGLDDRPRRRNRGRDRRDRDDDDGYDDRPRRSREDDDR